MNDLKSQLKLRFNLTDEQIDAVLNMFSTEIVQNALKATVFPSKELFKMNLKIYSKHTK